MELNKVARIGVNEDGNIFCKIELKQGDKGLCLSISGVIGPTRGGDCKGPCGQINDHIQPVFEYAPGWDEHTLGQFLEIWNKWHLNDMKAACEHQEELWDLCKVLSVTHYRWSSRFHDMRNKSQNGKLTPEQYKDFKSIAPNVMLVTIENKQGKFPELVQELLGDDWIEPKKPATQRANHTREDEHPEGILSKPCPVCGYKYGNDWLFRPLPADVVRFLHDLPETDKKPAWA